MLHPIVLVLTYFLISYYYAHIRFAYDFQFEPANLLHLTNFEAPAPFQYRILVPALIRITHDLLNPIGASIDQIAWWYEMLSTFLLLFSFRKFFSLFVPIATSELLTFLCVPLMAVNYILPYGRNVLYPWDTPSILFTTLGALALYKRKLTLYQAILLIATFNRETSFLLILILAKNFWKRPNRIEYILHMILSLSIWVGVKWTLFRTFPHQLIDQDKGGLFTIGLSQSLSDLQNGYLIIFLSTFGFLWIPIGLYFNRIRHPFLKDSCLAAIAFSLLVSIPGIVSEIRIYGELLPLVLMSYIEICFATYKTDPREQPDL